MLFEVISLACFSYRARSAVVSLSVNSSRSQVPKYHNANNRTLIRLDCAACSREADVRTPLVRNISELFS